MTRETILTALADLLRLIPFVPVLRGEVLPERVPTSGLIIYATAIREIRR